MRLIRQKDAMDCGPSCLAMIASHYSRNKDVRKFRNDCFMTKEGV